MARQEADREDLFAELKAYPQRAEWTAAGQSSVPATRITAGTKRGGETSIYFDGDPVYHFDAGGALRRAFVAGRIYRSDGSTLARLTRRRGADASELEIYDLAPQELADVLAAMHAGIEAFLCERDAGGWILTRAIPSAVDSGLIVQALQSATAAPRLAAALVRRRR